MINNGYWPDRDRSYLLEPTPEPKILSEEQEQIKLAMEQLDQLKLRGRLIEQEEAYLFEKRLSHQLFSDEMPSSAEQIGNSYQFTLFVEFDEGPFRKIGVKNGSMGIMFIVNKKTYEFTSFPLKKEGHVWNSSWVQGKEINLPAGDICVLASEAVKDITE